jgi:hypothetical protein
MQFDQVCAIAGESVDNAFTRFSKRFSTRDRDNGKQTQQIEDDFAKDLDDTVAKMKAKK